VNRKISAGKHSRALLGLGLLLNRTLGLFLRNLDQLILTNVVVVSPTFLVLRWIFLDNIFELRRKYAFRSVRERRSDHTTHIKRVLQIRNAGAFDLLWHLAQVLSLVKRYRVFSRIVPANNNIQRTQPPDIPISTHFLVNDDFVAAEIFFVTTSSL
jgi:hypothetical protein